MSYVTCIGHVPRDWPVPTLTSCAPSGSQVYVTVKVREHPGNTIISNSVANVGAKQALLGALLMGRSELRAQVRQQCCVVSSRLPLSVSMRQPKYVRLALLNTHGARLLLFQGLHRRHVW